MYRCEHSVHVHLACDLLTCSLTEAVGLEHWAVWKGRFGCPFEPLRFPFCPSVGRRLQQAFDARLGSIMQLPFERLTKSCPSCCGRPSSVCFAGGHTAHAQMISPPSQLEVASISQLPCLLRHSSIHALMREYKLRRFSPSSDEFQYHARHTRD